LAQTVLPPDECEKNVVLSFFVFAVLGGGLRSPTVRELLKKIENMLQFSLANCVEMFKMFSMFKVSK